MTENDDGSLASLGIPPDDSKKYFHCDETTQQKLTNKSFWVVDFIENVNTRYGSERYLIKIKFDLQDSEENTRKFFTNSREIKYVLDKIREMDKFPRKVTMRAQGTRYYFE